MESFLDRQAKILRDVAARQVPLQSEQGQANANANAQRQPKQKNAQGNQRTNENLPPCLLCRIKHPTYSCPTWLSMGMDERETFQRTNKLCITCVQPAHGKTPCWGKANWAKRCPACYDFNRDEIFHNSTLCRRAEAKRKQKTQNVNHASSSTSNQ